MSAMSISIPPVLPSEFYEAQRPQVHTLVAEATDLVNDVVELVVHYAIHLDLFGAAEWKRYFNRGVGEEPQLDDTFWKFWRGQDPADPTKRVWETHLPPVLRPEFVIDIDTKRREDFCLTVMGQLMLNPKEGHASQYYNADSEALRQHGRTEAGPACWLVMRKKVLGRSIFAPPYTQQIQVINNLKVGYEAGPSAIDLVAVVFTRFVTTKERYLGDMTELKNGCTYSRCKETVNDGEEVNQVLVGGHCLAVVGGPGPCGLHVNNDINIDNYRVSIAPLRKFPDQEI